jgi:hypothetical protein
MTDRHAKRQRREWDGDTPLYSDVLGEYFNDHDDIEFHLSEEGGTVEDLELLICEPVYLRKLDSNYWLDDSVTPEDYELPAELERAIDALNAVVDRIGPIGYAPTKFAVDLD